MKLNIKSLEQKFSNSGKTFFSITDDKNDRYSVWDAKLMDQINSIPENERDYTIEMNGNFRNITGVTRVEGSTPNLLPSRKDEIIIAQTLTKCASEIIASRKELTREAIENIQIVVWETYSYFTEKLKQ